MKGSTMKSTTKHSMHTATHEPKCKFSTAFISPHDDIGNVIYLLAINGWGTQIANPAGTSDFSVWLSKDFGGRRGSITVSARAVFLSDALTSARRKAAEMENR